MPLQRAIIERSPFHLSISNVRTLKRHKCRAPSRSVATLSIALPLNGIDSIDSPGACILPPNHVLNYPLQIMIALSGHNLSIEDLWRIASLQAPCELSGQARPRIRRSRELVETLAAQPRAIYGINTGFGPLSGYRVSGEELGQHQINLLHHLTVGQGALFSAAETRAIMLARANALARGYSGIREELIDLLLETLNRGI